MNLSKKHFLVKQEIDDKKNVDNLRTALKILNHNKDIVSYTILPTTNCNARCFYCYEAGCKHNNMSEQTIDKLISFIELHHGDKPINIQWFGGEPLVGLKQIDRICKLLTSKNIKFNSSMISNAYLFNEEIVKKAKEEWKLNKTQVTLDGTKNIYNQTKAYTNACDNPYKKVLDNIKLLMDNEIKVTIRLNLGLHNFDDLSKLVDELTKRYQDKKYLHIYCHILFENCGFEPTHFNEQELKLLYEKQDALNKQISQYEDLKRANELPKLKKYWCMSDNPSSILVSPSGMIGKCEHVIENKPVGYVDKGIVDKEELKNYAEVIVKQECYSCVLYPYCIKLKVCQENTCTPMLANEKIKDKIETIKDFYIQKRKTDKLSNNECDDEQKC